MYWKKNCEFDKDFLQRTDAANISGHSPYMELLAVMRHLDKGVPADILDDYTQMGATTIYHYAKKFMDAVIWVFNDRYMRRPTIEDTRRLLTENEARGFHGMLGSVDCVHWEWRCCPTDAAGQHVDHHNKPTNVLQAVASYDRWLWHCYFGQGGSNNDNNILEQSGLFDRELNGVAPTCVYRINGRDYDLWVLLG
ncbi:uncharacterized protein LOC113361455 [Papaver somniferum]|uniref:uncharacterized protein LOC113361455 n=1 Tax=Papaver somniferum TaxID=3469 RepID=UPI000E700FFD|nr:uncharacterized protein LOC113361455 [Papaver somniferum]